MSRRRLSPFIAASLVALFFSPPAIAQDAGASVYDKTLRSIVWVVSPRGKYAASGTGSLVDEAKKLVLTNYHVVGDTKAVSVLFPRYRDGRVIAERNANREMLHTQGIRGNVVARDQTRDLALIELERLPKGVLAIRLAEKSAAPGQSVHSLGNPGDSGALWLYTPGRVRQVYHQRWQAKLEEKTASFEAEVVETDSATNPGDSGGPLVNDRGELVGVTEGSSVKGRLLSQFIDLSEVRKFLKNHSIGEQVVKRRDKPLPVRDDGKFFSTETLAKANEAVERLFRSYQVDVLIETYPHPPAEKVEEVQAMKKQDRAAFFRDWAAQRGRAENIRGLVLLISRKPGHASTHWVGVAEKFDKPFHEKVASLLLTKIQEKKFDEALSQVLQTIEDKLVNKSGGG